VYALPVVNVALIGAGRTAQARAVTDAAQLLVAEMDAAPQMIASLHLGQAQVALAQDELDETSRHARIALDVATREHLCVTTVDALDVLSAVSGRRRHVSAWSIGRASAAQRRRLGHQFHIVPVGLAAEAR
jgi:hypothetical protein